MSKDFISLERYSSDQLKELLALTNKVKNDPDFLPQSLAGKSLGLVFQKPSNRTRVSFEVGIHQLGGHCIYLGPKEINLGVRETTADVAKTLTRYLDGIVARTFSHQDILTLAEHASVPVINALSDLFHPCQAVCDIFSIQEKFNDLAGLKIAYVGDGNNVAHSLMLAAAKVGINFTIACPSGYEMNAEIVTIAQAAAAENNCVIEQTNDPVAAVKDAQVIYADVWTSMGQEEEQQQRLNDFNGFMINADLVAHADPNYIFMHCLPAHRGEEVSAEVIDGEHSIVFDQAENRLHAQKSILISLFSK